MAKVNSPDQKPHWNSERLDRPPDPADKRAYLIWLFAMARRDHLAARETIREKALKDWVAGESERQRLKALRRE